MKKTKLILINLILLLNTALLSFPGEHNSLTCDQNFLGLRTTINNVANTILTDVNEKDSKNDDIPNTGILGKYYRRAADGLGSDPHVAANYANIVSAINSDIALPNSIVRDKLRRNHNFALHATIWGDSLSDFIDLYGMKHPSVFGLNDAAGNYGGYPFIMDSWSDYLTVFGGSRGNPFNVSNHAVAGDTSGSLLGYVNTTALQNLNWSDIDSKQSHCIQPTNKNSFGANVDIASPSAPRSIFMIGGNDILQAGIYGYVFPYIDKYKVEYTAERISFFIDWNIENGKQVLVEGTIPIYTEAKLPTYNTTIVNRKSICSPIEDSLIEPKEIPWWVCAFSPATCLAMYKAVVDHNFNVFKEFQNFNRFAFSDPLTIASINQACINDKLENDFGPAYTQHYPNHVFIEALYNKFNIGGNNIFAANFWVPLSGLYDKGDGGKVKDPIHVGYNGYAHWASIIGNRLKTLGWNNLMTPDKMPEAVIELDNDGPLKKIKYKAKAVGVYTKEKKKLPTKIPSIYADSINGVGAYGGYFQEYKDNSRIYLKQLATEGTAASDRFGDAFHIGGRLLTRYLQEGGPKGSLGYPVTDMGCTHFCTIDTIYFEKGRIDHNKLNLLEPENTYVHLN